MWLLMAVLLLLQAPSSSEGASKQKKALNPEALMNVSQIICHKGYPSEEYEVLTDDGYYIHLNRIPHGREKPKNRGAKPVVFLQHGIFGEGSHWVENLANNSLGFILADSGYDVWLANSRGTSWSRRHQHLSADQVEFWDFSFHEMAMFDLPAAIDFVLQKTGQKQLHYVGYSQGCTIAFIAFSSIPELAQKVKMFFALAPAVSLKHSRSPLMKILVLFQRVLQSFGELLFANMTLLDLTVTSHEGWDAQTRLDVYTSHYPDGTSVKNIIHWAQAWSQGSQSHPDTPPLYPLEQMPVPTAVWSGGQDWAADWRDVLQLLPRISHLVTYTHIPDWNHWDFVWGLDAPGRLYSSMLSLMEVSQYIQH
uniref:AB hydrolase-1 domain-containing protein n=1 Tax=Zonotrichia albicollis TaxID=44394 RepID=A0A8D2MEU8_ZONAL